MLISISCCWLARGIKVNGKWRIFQMQITEKLKELEKNRKHIWNPHGTSYLMSRCNSKKERVEHLRTLVPTAKKAKGWAGLCAYQACQYLKRVLLFLWLYFRITTLFYHWYACVRRTYIRNKFSLTTVTQTSSTIFSKNIVSNPAVSSFLCCQCDFNCQKSIVHEEINVPFLNSIPFVIHTTPTLILISPLAFQSNLPAPQPQLGLWQCSVVLVEIFWALPEGVSCKKIWGGASMHPLKFDFPIYCSSAHWASPILTPLLSDPPTLQMKTLSVGIKHFFELCGTILEVSAIIHLIYHEYDCSNTVAKRHRKFATSLP